VKIADFNHSPFIAIWEVTRACDLACLHCRADAVVDRHADELTTLEGFQLLADIRRFGQPVVVLTGGDPLKRPDILSLISHGASLGLRMTMTPSGTPLATRSMLLKCKDAGLLRLAVSLDDSTAERHDRFRQVKGSFDTSVKMLLMAREIGLSTQVNTTVTRYNLDDLDEIARMMERLGIDLWSVFFLVPTGRGKAEDEISPEEHEIAFSKMYRAAARGFFDVKSTAAPHYRRYVLERKRAERSSGVKLATPSAFDTGLHTRAPAVNDANGFVFVSHTGDVYPSGFLPVVAGNVRDRSIVELYRESPLFVSLRDTSLLEGKCGVCEYRKVCGGSRARAYAHSGRLHASDPYCAYIPRELGARVSEEEAS
jgi:radical SAM protein